MASIKLENIQKTYPNGHVAARGIDLEIADGEFVVLVGPSGCGKSTTLRMVAGLETPTGGRLYIGDRDVTEVPPQDRDIAMVFQTYALYPHKTVSENLAFGLRMRGAPKDTIAESVDRAAKILGLEQFLDRKPAQLSGGQRQRVALGRAIVREPKAFLLDEPLSNLDAKLRIQTRAELARMHRDLGATMLYVTHDQEEAMTLGDRIAVMDRGILQQVAPPLDVYRRPANEFVAGFVGSPPMNFFDGSLKQKNGETRFDCGAFTVQLEGPVQAEGGGVPLGLRPQDISLVGAADADAVADVDVVEPLGSSLLGHLVISSAGKSFRLTIVVPADADLKEGGTVGLGFPRDRLHLFDKDGGSRLN
ncbi:MAG: sn-glycerol-3-phosphate ABC transporter ATP-binding protein UgpC [Myxococcota bacterium]